MRIAFLSRYQGKLNRGAENFVDELSKRLSNKHIVEVLSGHHADSLAEVLGGKYDVVIPVNGRLQSLKVSLGRLVRNYKLLITGHSGIGRDDIWNIALCRPDVFVVLTDFQKNWVSQWAWGTKVAKIPNGIDLENFSPKGNKIELDLARPIVLSVGALTWYKHHDRVIRTVAKISDGSLLIVGDGPEKNKLENLGQRLLGKRFKIIKVNYKDMPVVYRSCDLFTLPSWDREAFGIVYLEALACGLGIVAPDDPVRREIIGEAGILVDTLDLEKYSKAIDQALKINWVKKAREQAKKFSWEKVAGKYEKLMSDMIKV